MSLGVLNNLSAVYAENSLNNTNNSLSKTLQQLSSGSQDQLRRGRRSRAFTGQTVCGANQQALAQSQTNATEGVGLLQVADGALSQVTSLLNRAVTLATEASNGTLNTSQDAAANQEYQSILSEINNIGNTTTYNQNQVFNGAAAGVSIYTGDSSSQSASVDDLYFASLVFGERRRCGRHRCSRARPASSSTCRNDTAGALTTAATMGDAVTGALKFTITNPDSTTSTVTTTATSVSALIQEINKDGIPGVTASFTTAGAAGDAGVNSGDTGILLTNSNASVAIADRRNRADGYADHGSLDRRRFRPRASIPSST